MVGQNGLEGKKSAPYRDIAGIWTDCYGNTHNVNPQRIRSEKECADLARGELDALFSQIVKLVPITANDYDLAYMLSFSYNVGIGAFKRSTLLRKFNAGNKTGACKELFKWVYAGSVYVQGLYNRREVEYQICMVGATS